MKITSVEVRRVFNMGDYENLRLGATVELEDGDTLASAIESAHEQIVAEKDAVVEATKARWAAMRNGNRGFEIGPDDPALQAVGGNLLKRARVAHELTAAHNNVQQQDEACEKCMEYFGILADFQVDAGGNVSAKVATDEGEVTLAYASGDFNVLLPDDTMVWNVRSLAQLGSGLLRAERHDGKEDIIF